MGQSRGKVTGRAARNESMVLKLPAPSLIVLVGPSGSGKSTWAKEHFATNEVVSSDDLRAVVGAGEDDQSASQVAFEVLERILDERLRRGLTTVIDTLGLDGESRTRWIAKAREAGVPIHAVVFETPAEICEERNRTRPRPIPVAVLRRQLARFKETAPQLEGEGFDGIHREVAVATVAPSIARSVETSPIDTADATGHSFGLMVSRMDWPPGDRGEQLVSIARRAETAGFRDIWLMDHFRQIRGVGRPWEDLPEAYTALGYMAGATSRIRLGALVTAVTHRPPVVLGKMVATLDVLSGGRAVCGLGIGWDVEEHAASGIAFPDVSTRYSILEETLRMLPLLWGKGTTEFRGEHIVSDGLVCYPRPVQDPIPILVGGGGEKRTLRLAARHAAACNVFGDPERVAHKALVLARHCEEIERDPAEIEVTHLTTALAAADRTDLRDRVERLRDRNTTPEAYMERNHAGTVDDLTDLFAAYAAAGAGHSIVAIPDVVAEGSIEAFGEVIRNLGST
jgi:F420-dependent oxidoreductase-like protein